MRYFLLENDFTLMDGPIILLDCPTARVKQEPEMAFKAMKAIEEVWREMYSKLEEENKQLKEQLK